MILIKYIIEFQRQLDDLTNLLVLRDYFQRMGQDLSDEDALILMILLLALIGVPKEQIAEMIETMTRELEEEKEQQQQPQKPQQKPKQPQQQQQQQKPKQQQQEPQDVPGPYEFRDAAPFPREELNPPAYNPGNG